MSKTKKFSEHCRVFTDKYQQYSASTVSKWQRLNPLLLHVLQKKPTTAQISRLHFPHLTIKWHLWVDTWADRSQSKRILWWRTSSSISSRSYLTTERLMRGSVSGERSRVGANTIAMFSPLIMFWCWCSDTLHTCNTTYQLSPWQTHKKLVRETRTKSFPDN